MRGNYGNMKTDLLWSHIIPTVAWHWSSQMYSIKEDHKAATEKPQHCNTHEHRSVFADVDWTSIHISNLAEAHIALLRLHGVTHWSSALWNCGKAWRHLAVPLAGVCEFVLMWKNAFYVSERAQLVHMCSLHAFVVRVGVQYACDITTASLMTWLMSALPLVWIISCVFTPERADVYSGGPFFLF